MTFAATIGQLAIFTPYIIQPSTPVLNMLYMGSETPDKSRVFHECNACGTKAKVVKNAEKYPIKSVVFISKFSKKFNYGM
jgi:hypothetical protein